MLKCKTVWISDIHLGTRNCKATILLDFLRSLDCDNLYLVGDIIDGWKLKNQFNFPQKHVDVLRKLLKMANNGMNVTYITGNHDEFLRTYTSEFDELNIGKNISLKDEDVYQTVDGKLLYILHGDKFDSITRYHRLVAIFGDHAYELLLYANNWFNILRRHLGMGYWSLSAFLKHKVKQAVNFITEFEEAISNECKDKGYDGVVCGHIHHPEIKTFDSGITYFNDGDFVESCSALIEHNNGRFDLIQLWSNGKIQEEPKILSTFKFNNENTNNNRCMESS